MRLKTLSTLVAASAMSLLSACSSTKPVSQTSLKDLKLPPKGQVSFKEFIKVTVGKPYVYPAPFDIKSERQMYSAYDCVTLTLSYLTNCYGADLERGRTNSGDKILSDHLREHTSVRLNGGELSVKRIGSGSIKRGDIILIGQRYSKCEKGFSVTHFLIVDEVKNKGGKLHDIKVVHANSTGKYNQEREVIYDRFREYMIRRDGKALFQEALICTPREKLGLFASN